MEEAEPIVSSPKIKTYMLEDDGKFPNNPTLPLIVYKGVAKIDGKESLIALESRLRNHNWRGIWRNGVFPYHHYHSNAHELLVVYDGKATIQFGGDQGIKLEVEKGDAILLPAGTAHKKLGSNKAFMVLGAYPNGGSYDINYGKSSERPRADEKIKNVPLPGWDPFYGSEGPMHEHWK